MISRLAVPIQVAILVTGLAVGSLPSPASAQDIKFRDGRFREAIGGVTIQRADDASSDEAVLNMPFLPGDRVWTDDSGRAEIIFAEGEVLWIAERSKVDSLGRGGADQDERLGLRVFAGSFGARGRPAGPGFEFRAPGGSITTTGAATFRVDVRAGETVVSVSEGEVLADLGGERLSLRSGERVRYADGQVGRPFAYDRADADRFDRWCDDRSAELNRVARRDDRLPDELDDYGDELEKNGDWVYDEPQGYVYVPRVAYDWAPYTYGRWVYTLYGWTWVADEPWGFVTSHYGRWGYSSRIGWHWLPRTGFSGAWVGWSSPVGRWSNTIGWCALGFNDRPVGSFGYGTGGRAVSRYDARSIGRGWSFTNRSDMGRANIQRRRVDLPADEAQRAVAWNPGAAPDRDFRQGRRSPASPAQRTSATAEAIGVARRGEGRSGRDSDDTARINVRPSPGDSLPELRSDPTTTIPSPESRRERTIGQDGFKDEQNNHRGRSRRDDSTFSLDESVTSPSSDSARQRSSGRTEADPQATSRSDDARSRGSQEPPARDPLLSRFFRSITRPSSSGRESSPAREDDSSARRRDPQPRDDSSARQDNPRERSRPSDAGRERARPSGGERSQPRSSPPPRRPPPDGASDNRGERRRPPKDK
ncbi:MAG: FecR domain-containing protein [Vicinamibacteria bacterium]|nr:FecR domain-containing protein [Vicinamibacteria bacterium]